MTAKTYSTAIIGIKAQPIEVEVDLGVGLHSFNIVGLPDKAVEESKDRVSSAIKNSGALPPQRQNRRITVNLAPADLKKEGSTYDLAIAIGYLLASKQIKEFKSEDKIFLGELALDGSIREAAGVLPAALMAGRMSRFCGQALLQSLHCLHSFALRITSSASGIVLNFLRVGATLIAVFTATSPTFSGSRMCAPGVFPLARSSTIASAGSLVRSGRPMQFFSEVTMTGALML